MPFNLNLTVRFAAFVALTGFILSGLVAVAAVFYIAPQPKWESAATFQSNFHWIQTLPYFFGFVLVSGLVLLVQAHKNEYKGRSKKLDDALQLSYGSIFLFAGLIIFNYICQTTFIPNLVGQDIAGKESLIAGFSMSNPRSLSWALEMWGYAIMATSLWLLSGCYKQTNKAIPGLLLTNLIASLASLAWSIADPGWVETTPGLILFLFWNALMILIAWLIFKHAGTTA